MQVLFEQVVRSEIRVYDEWFAAAMLVEDGMCKGVIARDLRTGELHPFHAKSTVIATGNLGQMYNGGTCSLTGTGDGVALAYRAGVPLIDMEMVQYHPTTLADRGILISEAVRAEGAHLVNKKGERFMERYDADAMEMSTRDVVARAALTEVRKNRGEKGHVFLDMRHLDKARMVDRLQETLWIMDDLEGLDPSEDLIPVKPGMHRPLGGIKIDTLRRHGSAGTVRSRESALPRGCTEPTDWEATRCWTALSSAVGPASRRADMLRGATWRPATSDLVAEQSDALNEVTEKDANSDTAGSIRRDLGEVMDKNVGMVRSLRGLRRAASAVAKLRERHACVGRERQERRVQHGVEVVEGSWEYAGRGRGDHCQRGGAGGESRMSFQVGLLRSPRRRELDEAHSGETVGGRAGAGIRAGGGLVQVNQNSIVIVRKETLGWKSNLRSSDTTR